MSIPEMTQHSLGWAIGRYGRSLQTNTATPAIVMPPRRLRIGLRASEPSREFCPATWAVRHVQAAVVRLRNALRDRQPQPCAAERRAARRVAAIHGGKDMRQILGRDARPAICDAE